ncbi:MAG: hypothetical protein ISS31_02170 [Kiritimatiellae bacterium]|nr:hypothetical protein [Kiritimatiellia bacterium]
MRWIDLDEEHFKNRLSVGDPSFGSTATSSPFGARSLSPYQFRDHMQFLRERLRDLLRNMACEKSNGACHSLEARAELLAVYGDFMRARRSAFGWQDLHAADVELIRQTERYL